MPSATERSLKPTIFVTALCMVAAVVWLTGVHGPFVFDDIPAIVENPSIRRAADLAAVLNPPSDAGNTVGGRPLLNASLALNYAAGRLSPIGYRLVNIALHLASGCLLFGIVRRTLVTTRLVSGWGEHAVGIATIASAVWLLHPLQTESVTYVVQRAESLMGFFYLLTLYAFIRGTDSSSRGWLGLAALSCLAGMATKEVMVTVPVVVLLYDRTFLSDGFGRVLRERTVAYAGLFATWLLLAWFVVHAGNRGGTIGASAGIEWWQYALCQSRAWWHYLRQGLMPFGLTFDYGPDFVSFGQVVGYVVLDVVIVAATVVGLWRGRIWAFLVACFLGILAPSSSVVGGTRQMMAEHRVYLSLAIVAIAAVSLSHRAIGRRMLALAAVAVAAFGALTVARNRDYRSEIAIWTDTVTKRPQNAMAHGNLGYALANAGKSDAAEKELRTAIALNPAYADPHHNLANLLYQSGQSAEAIDEYRTAIRLDPGLAEALGDYGFVLTQLGRPEEGLPLLERALQLKPGFANGQTNLAVCLLALNRNDEALEHARAGMVSAPTSAAAHNTLGVALVRRRDFEGAEREFVKAVELDPNLQQAQQNLARMRAMRTNAEKLTR